MGRKFSPMHVAQRFREISCSDCGVGFIAYGRRKNCDGCKRVAKASPIAKLKTAAHRQLRAAIRSGVVWPQACQACIQKRERQIGRSNGHHEDYNRPLDVIWLCSWHHKARHAEIERGVPLRASSIIEAIVDASALGLFLFALYVGAALITGAA